MSSFEPEQFLDAAITQPLVKRPPADAGRPYPATIGEPKTRSWSSEKNGEHREGFAMDVPLEIALPDDVAARVGQAKIILSDGVFLDTTESGALDMAPGRNRGLRTYYEAVGLNKPGTTPRMLQGRMVQVILRHETGRDGSGDLFERVQSVGKA